jgi:signal transduction histidine kinase
VLRHAGTPAATVRIGYHPDELSLEITDAGNGKPSSPRAAQPTSVEGRGDGDHPPSLPLSAARPGSPGGHGITGMIERAAALGGTLQAGPGPRGGFRVAARLPWRKVDS